MKFDRSIFFDKAKEQFGAFNQGQVNGLERLLWGFETYFGWWDMLEQIANALTQVGHETAHSYNPVVEGYYLGDAHAAGYFTGNTERVRNFQKHLRYYPYFGQGDIQLTWPENYTKLDAYIRKYFPEIVDDFKARTGQAFDLAHVPAQALDGKISFCIFTLGMHLGLFRAGHTLDRYIHPGGVDHFNARDIVNGDKNYLIKGTTMKIGTRMALDAHKWETVLRASLLNGGTAPALPELEQAEIVKPPSPPSNLPTDAEHADSTGTTAADNPLPSQDPPAQEQPPIEVKQTVVGEATEKVNQVATWYAALPAGLTAFGTAILAWFQGARLEIILSCFGAATLIAITYLIIRAIRNEKKDQRAEAAAIRAHELTVMQMQSAMNKNLNTVKVVPA